MRPELVLMRVPHQRRPPYPAFGACDCPSPLHRSFTGVAHWDPNRAFHLGVIANEGILQTYTVESQEGGAAYTLSPASAYQLHLLYGEDSPPVKELTVRGYNSLKLRTKAVDVQLGSFEYIPGRHDEILFFQLNSSRILFARLPVGYSGTGGGSDTEKTSKVFCIGSHSVSIVCISVRSDGLAMLSAASDGSIRVWRLSDGTMLCETAMSYAHPGNAQLSYWDRQSKRTCGFCGEVLQNIWTCAKLLLFVGQTWELAMGCLDGFLRFWTTTSEGLPPDNSVRDLELLSTETLFSSSEASISALAVHSPDFEGVIGSHLVAAEEGAGFQALSRIQGALSPTQQQEAAFRSIGVVQDGSPRGMQDHDLSSPSLSTEFLAAGTTEGGLMVWARYAGSHGWARTWSRISANVSIVCLSFRADGGLLAAGASVLATPPEPAAQGISGELVDKVHLYETSSWSCVGTLNFHSSLGSCSFYKPNLVEEGVEEEWKSALGMLLVCTSDGPEAHLVPDLCSPPNDLLWKRNLSKSVKWADTEEGRLHFGDYEGGEVLVQEPRSMERNVSQVGNDADVDKPPSKLANPSDCNAKSAISKKPDKSRRSTLEKGEKTRKEVRKPEWDSSVAKIEVGMKMDLISKEGEGKDPHFTRLKGGRGRPDAQSGSRKKDCRLNSMNGQSEEHMPQVAEDHALEEESCRLCSHPLSDHCGLASGQVTMRARQTVNAVHTQSDNAEGSYQGSRWSHIQETPAVPQDEEARGRDLHTNMCNCQTDDSSNGLSCLEPNQGEEGAFRNLCPEQLGDHPFKVLGNPKNCCMSSAPVAETQGESYQTPVLDQAQDAQQSRGCENGMSCRGHSSSTVAEQDNHGAGYVGDMEERCEDISGSQGLTNESQEALKGRPLRPIVPDNAPALEEHMVTAKQPRSPSSLPTVGSALQNKAHSQHKKLGQASTPRPFSRKENRAGDEQRIPLQHAAGKSTKICSVCDTPIPEQHLHDHSRISSEVHSMSASYYENHHLINKCSICSAPTKEHQQHQQHQREDLRWWRELTTSGVEYTNVQEKSWSWNHGCHKKDVCQEMCEHFQMQAEKDSHRQRMPSSGNIFQREFAEYQASLLAHYAKSRANKRSHREICRSCHHAMSNHVGQHNGTQEDGNPRSHEQQHPRGFRITKPMSGCQSDEGLALDNFPAELIQGYRMGKRNWPLHTKREVCVGCSRPGSERLQETNPNPVDEEANPMLSISRSKPKLLEEKKLRFCTGLHRGKGEIMPPPPKRRVLPVVSLSRDKQKGVWSRKENQKEWGSGHRGCCSQQWVSLLETSKRVCHTQTCHGEGGCNRSTDSTTMTPDVVATLQITKKFQAVRGGKFHRSHAAGMEDGVTTLVGCTGSLDGKTRPQSAAGISGHMDSGSPTPRSISSCGGARRSIAVTPAAKLVSPELNSSAWILAKVEELHKEPFTAPKALQVAKEHGFVLNEEDEAELKHYLRDMKKHITPYVDPRLLEAEHQEKRTREKYIDLSSINAPPPVTKGNAAPRKVSKQVDKEVGARRKTMPAISDLWVASDQCPQVCSKGNFNLTQLNMEPEESEEARIWAARESACREALASMDVYDSCCM